MDKLKKELEERKRKVAEEKAAASAGSKYVRRGDIEKIQAAKAEPPKPVPAPEPAPAPAAAAVPKEPADAERKVEPPRQEAASERVEEENHNEKVAASAPREEEIHVTLTEDSPMEDKIIFKFQGWMREWGDEVEEQPEALKRTAAGKAAIATFQQTKKYLHPFYRMLHTRNVPLDVVQAVYEISRLLDLREYLKANDTYLRLAIGNAAWPMGVTAVGIHERSGREKIFTNKVAHIMNDEMQRKYIQSIKRVITFLQKKYPNDPSKNMG